MSQTTNLLLPRVLAAQAQKHVPVNMALNRLDALVQLAVLDKDLSAPPPAPADGQRWIVGPAPGGLWAGRAGHIAAWQDGVWSFLVPREGWLAWAADEDRLYVHDGAAWTLLSAGGGGAAPVSGAWTSVLRGATVAGANSYSAQIGRFTRVGDAVILSGALVLSARDPAMAGGLQLAGLPALAHPDNRASIVLYHSNVTRTAGTAALMGYIGGSTQTADLFEAAMSGASQLLPPSAVAAGSIFFLSGVYHAA